MEGIRMSDCKFYVNEAERTVVCVIPIFPISTLIIPSLA